MQSLDSHKTAIQSVTFVHGVLQKEDMDGRLYSWKQGKQC